MGAADVVPGVSGGTIAFISGIYEELLNSIKSIQPSVLTTLKNEGIKSAWAQINGTFLITLFAGIAVSILSLARVIKHLLENFPELLWAFFFGLIIASAIFIGKQITKWSASGIVALFAGAGIAYYITIAAPAEAPTDLWFIFVAGMVAISAMILPGISGSFILLLMGLYNHIIGAIKDFQLEVIAVFGAGCVVGLLTFSHVLSWMFRNFKNTTLALLTGFMIGSLNKVWPWKKTLETRINSHGIEVPFLQENVLPSNYLTETGNDPYLLGAIALVLVGFAVVYGLESFSKQPEKTA